MRRPTALPIALVLVLASLSGCILEEDGNKVPKAHAGDDARAEVGEEVVFSGSGIDKDGSIVEFRWDFDGDGRWDYEGDVGAHIHVFTSPGSYEAVLQVQDDEGARASDTRWVNVTATVRIVVDWVNGTGFRVLVPDRLDATRLEVDWTLEGSGPSPIARTFTPDAGLDRVDNVTYALDPELASIEAGDLHTVEVRLGDVTLASRTIDVVDRANAAYPYTARYLSTDQHTVWREQNWTWHNATGELVVESGTGWVREMFEGTAREVTYTNRSGVQTWVNLTLDDVTSYSRQGVDGKEEWEVHEGFGTVDQWDLAGLTIEALVLDYVRAVENGSLTKDDWRRVGSYSGANDTNGTFVWTRVSEGNQVRQNGEGELYEVLRVRSERDFGGTNLGRVFTLHNLTVTFDASRLVFDNGTLFSESQQEVGYQDAEGNWSWTNRTIAGFVDTDGDGVYNPDAMPFDLELATELTGPRPRELQVGDRYKAQNFYGFELRYTVKRTDTAPLQLPGGTLDVTGVIAEAITNTTAGYAHHWMWVVQDGPLPGLVYEESRYLWFPGYGGGPHDWYRNIVAVDEY